MTKDLELRDLRVAINRLVDPKFPGFVECAFVDASGTQIAIVEKLPVVSNIDAWDNENVPIEGRIACELEASFIDDKGQEVARISTERPWGISSTNGETRFVVLTSTLLSDP